MRKIYLSVLSIAVSVFTANAQLIINTQFINPCGGDEHNEFIVAKTTSLPVSIADICFGSYNPGGGNLKDYNYWWSGTNTASSPFPVFSSVTGKSCGDGLNCYGFRYPSIPADNADITQLINELNAIAGCNVFIPVPSTNLIPANSNVIVFVGAGYRGTSALCGFDNAATNLNFTNHCNGGVATTTYYAVFGNASGANPNCANVGSGYFSNSQRRVSALHVLKAGGDNSMASGYISSEQDYTPGDKDSASVSAGLIVPDGNGGTTWVNDKGCIPTPDVILAIKLEYFRGSLQNKKVTLNWKSSFEEAIKLFVIEKSIDGIHFTQLTTAQPANISGSSYSAIDANLASGYNFYRLKTMHQNGTTEYSNVVKFNFNRGSDNLTIFPNPSTGSASISYQSATVKNAALMVTDITGKLISKTSIRVLAGSNRLNVPTERLSSGTYIIQVVSNSITDKAVFIKK